MLHLYYYAHITDWGSCRRTMIEIISDIREREELEEGQDIVNVTVVNKSCVCLRLNNHGRMTTPLTNARSYPTDHS